MAHRCARGCCARSGHRDRACCVSANALLSGYVCTLSFLSHLAHGAAGLTKAALGIDRTDQFRLDYRREACSTCPQATRKLGVLDTCTLCGCVLSAKTAVASEHCPAGKW